MVTSSIGRPLEFPDSLLTSVMSSRLFTDVAFHECRRLAALARIKTYSPRDMLFDQGDRAQSIFLVRSGCIKLTQIGSDGREVILWIRGPQEAVGIFASEEQLVHSCRASVLTPTCVMVWDRAALERHPSAQLLARNIASMIASYARDLEQRFCEILTDRVPRRVATTLVRLSNQVGRPTSGGFELLLSREELAQMTGTTIYTISRLMTQWRSLGFLEPKREAILILYPDRLLQWSFDDGHEDFFNHSSTIS